MGDNGAMADSSGTTLITTLGLAPGDVIGVLNPPDPIAVLLGPLPDGASLVDGVRSHRDVVLAFFHRRTEFEQKVVAMTKAIAATGVIWVLWPSTPERTDITVQALSAMAGRNHLVDTGTCEFDGWSGLRLVARCENRP